MGEVEDLNAKVQKRSLLRRRRLRADYQAVFGTDVGRRVLVDLFHSCLLENVGYMQKETALHMQGRHWVYARIHKILNLDDEELQRLVEENR